MSKEKLLLKFKLSPGRVEVGRIIGRSIMIDVEFKLRRSRDGYGREFSLVVLSLSGSLPGCYGQIYDTLYEFLKQGKIILSPEWTEEQLLLLLTNWKRWHLNDLRPGCQHQRDWPVDEKVTTQELEWGPRFHQARRDAGYGKLSLEHYANFQEILYADYREVVPQVFHFATNTNRPLWLDPKADALLREDWLKLGKQEIKSKGWLDYRRHPEGLLCKPCPTCGYKYGTRWLGEQLPKYVWEWLRALPRVGGTTYPRDKK